MVKADGYGHGAAPSAAAALRGGATTLAVAAAAEAEELRFHFPEAPILVMGALTGRELRTALAAGAEVAVWREGFRELCSRLAGESGAPVRVHVKHDSGMGRLGERDPDAVVELARALRRGRPASSWPGSGPTSRPPTSRTPAYLERQLAAFERGRRPRPRDRARR